MISGKSPLPQTLHQGRALALLHIPLVVLVLGLVVAPDVAFAGGHDEVGTDQAQGPFALRRFHHQITLGPLGPESPSLLEFHFAPLRCHPHFAGGQKSWADVPVAANSEAEQEQARNAT